MDAVFALRTVTVLNATLFFSLFSSHLYILHAYILDVYFEKSRLTFVHIVWRVKNFSPHPKHTSTSK